MPAIYLFSFIFIVNLPLLIAYVCCFIVTYFIFKLNFNLNVEFTFSFLIIMFIFVVFKFDIIGSSLSNFHSFYANLNFMLINFILCCKHFGIIFIYFIIS